MAPHVTVYSTDACPFCIQAKRLLDKRGIAYDEINLSRNPEGRDTLVAKTGMFTFPQILVGDELVGGFQETRAADKSGRLAELLADQAKAA